MRLSHLLFPFAITILAAACTGDYRPNSIGAADEVYVVMDSTQWNSETALALNETFGAQLETVPGYENKYRLIFRDFRTNQQLEQLKEYKNVIFAAPLDDETNTASFIRALLSSDVEDRVRNRDSFAFPLQDQWVRDQWVLLLTSVDDDALADKIRNSEESLVSHLMEREFERRTHEVYRRGEQTDISDALWENHGWKVRIQHDYVQTVDTSNVVVFRRYLPDNDRWMWAWWKDDVEDVDFVNEEWINATRDSLMEIYLRGERDESFITTEYRRPVETSEMETGSRIKGFETLGTWRMTNDFMGGPFVNFTYFDPETERLFMVEYGQFAPSVNKRRFVRQFQAMGRTFKPDSTWNANRETDSITE